MAIVTAGFDVHRAQITFDAVDHRDRRAQKRKIDATPQAVIDWVEPFRDREVDVALEACTGWYFVGRSHVKDQPAPQACHSASVTSRRRCF
jgi:hypothetical protein